MEKCEYCPVGLADLRGHALGWGICDRRKGHKGAHSYPQARWYAALVLETAKWARMQPKPTKEEMGRDAFLVGL